MTDRDVAAADAVDTADDAPGYRPEGLYLWDFWVLPADGEYHLFHLEAPRELPPAERHHHARVGHAVSTDLTDWERVGVALDAADDPEAWDSKSLWTGWALTHEGTHYLFYTGRRESEGGHTQRVGVATSEDLRTWERHPANPILTADEGRYAGRDVSCDGTVAWRDPCVIRDPEPDSGDWLAFVTARDRERPRGERGCVARARSPDLIDWTVEEPALSPGRFRDVEVPSLHERDGRWYMLFAVQAPWYASDYAATLDPAGPQTGVLYATADAPAGEWTQREEPLLGTESGQYTGRVVRTAAGDDVFLTWHLGSELGGARTPASYSMAAPRRFTYGDDGSLGLTK